MTTPHEPGLIPSNGVFFHEVATFIEIRHHLGWFIMVHLCSSKKSSLAMFKVNHLFSHLGMSQNETQEMPSLTLLGPH